MSRSLSETFTLVYLLKWLLRQVRFIKAFSGKYFDKEFLPLCAKIGDFPDSFEFDYLAILRGRPFYDLFSGGVFIFLSGDGEKVEFISF